MRTKMTRSLGLIACLILIGRGAGAADLNVETAKAYDTYVASADCRMKSRLSPASKFLWLDENPVQLSQVTSGDIQVRPMEGHGSRTVPNGLIHDWFGAAFIPNITVEELLSVTQNYNRYKDIYGPTVVSSTAISKADGEDRFSLRLVHKASMVPNAIDTQYEVRTFQIDEQRWYSISESTSVREIRNYGKADEYELPPGEGNGYIWKLHSISRYEQRNGGVYVEIEVIVLTRGIPGSLRWLLQPMIAKLSRNSLLISLSQTRDALGPLKRVTHEMPGGQHGITVSGTGFLRR